MSCCVDAIEGKAERTGCSGALTLEIALSYRRAIVSKAVKKRPELKMVTSRLFKDDVDTLQKIAEERGTQWQVELRLLIRRALKNEKREFVIIK